MAHEPTNPCEPLTTTAPHTVTGEYSETAPCDAALRAAIVAAAGALHFDNHPGSWERHITLGLFVAALSGRLRLAYPQSADALEAVVFSPATTKNPAAQERHQ